jgi:hypothetical protein
MGVNGCVYGCQNWHSVGRPDFRNARFVKVGTYNGSAFVSGLDDGRGFGSAFRHHQKQEAPPGASCFWARSREGIETASGTDAGVRTDSGHELLHARCREDGLRLQAQARPARPIPAGSTIHKGSEILRALFFWLFPGQAGGSAAGDVAPEMPEMAFFRPGAVSVLRLACG